MLRARLRVEGPAASGAVEAMAPEAGRELPRTETTLSESGGAAVVEITAADTSAMRAALNSHLECIRIIEDIGRLTEDEP